jgi:hypothetical protein
VIFMLNLLAALVLGQACGAGYGAGYGNYNYGRSYGYGYNNYGNYNYNYPIYVPYVEKVKIVSVEQSPYQAPVYAALAATPLRNEERYQEYRSQQPQQTMVYTQTIPQPQQVAYQVPASQAVPQSTPQAVPQSTPQAVPQSTPQALLTQPTPQVQQVQQAPLKASPEIPEKNTPEINYNNQAVPFKAAPLSSNQGGGEQDSGTVSPPPLAGVVNSIYGVMGADDSSEQSPPSFTPPIRTVSDRGFGDSRGDLVYSLDIHTSRILSNNCASCHTGARSKGSFSLFSSPGQPAALTKGNLEDMYDQILLGQQNPGKGMPQKRSMSSADGTAVLNALRGILATTKIANR